MIISIDTEEAFDKNSTSIHGKNSQKTRSIGGNFLNLTKNIYKKPTTNIILNDEKLEALPLIKGTKQECILS